MNCIFRKILVTGVLAMSLGACGTQGSESAINSETNPRLHISFLHYRAPDYETYAGSIPFVRLADQYLDLFIEVRMGTSSVRHPSSGVVYVKPGDYDEKGMALNNTYIFPSAEVVDGVASINIKLWDEDSFDNQLLQEISEEIETDSLDYLAPKKITYEGPGRAALTVQYEKR